MYLCCGCCCSSFSLFCENLDQRFRWSGILSTCSWSSGGKAAILLMEVDSSIMTHYCTKQQFNRQNKLDKSGDKNSTRNYEWNLERTSNSSKSTRHITYHCLMLFIVYSSKGQVHVFAGQMKIVSHSSCRTSAILKYFCPLQMEGMTD